jgi:hypothetical protein
MRALFHLGFLRGGAMRRELSILFLASKKNEGVGTPLHSASPSPSARLGTRAPQRKQANGWKRRQALRSFLKFPSVSQPDGSTLCLPTHRTRSAFPLLTCGPCLKQQTEAMSQRLHAPGTRAHEHARTPHAPATNERSTA